MNAENKRLNKEFSAMKQEKDDLERKISELRSRLEELRQKRASMVIKVSLTAFHPSLPDPAAAPRVLDQVPRELLQDERGAGQPRHPSPQVRSILQLLVSRYITFIQIQLFFSMYTILPENSGSKERRSVIASICALRCSCRWPCRWLQSRLLAQRRHLMDRHFPARMKHA